MRYSVIAVGKLKEPWLRQGCSEFAKRIRRYASLTLEEVPDLPSAANASAAQEAIVRNREGEKITARLKPRAFVIALDQRGKGLSSEAFAHFLDSLTVKGIGAVTFIIGGSLGIAPELLSRADMRLSFSNFTFPHQLMRLILLEQLYRACKINAGEAYHK